MGLARPRLNSVIAVAIVNSLAAISSRSRVLLGWLLLLILRMISGEVSKVREFSFAQLDRTKPPETPSQVSPIFESQNDLKHDIRQ
jgi:MFS-type transporter involved in bile tolerance (Atg22 family)